MSKGNERIPAIKGLWRRQLVGRGRELASPPLMSVVRYCLGPRLVPTFTGVRSCA